MSGFLQLAHDRYSCRQLSDEPVEAEKVDAILEAAIAAPTAVDRQPWHAWVITDPSAVERVRAVTRYHFDANTFVVVGGRADEAWTRGYDGRGFADVDATIVATHVMLATHDLGLGTAWVASFDAPALREAFPQMEGYDLVGMFPIGHPAPDAAPSPKHLQRKPVEELVTRI